MVAGRTAKFVLDAGEAFYARLQHDTDFAVSDLGDAEAGRRRPDACSTHQQRNRLQRESPAHVV